MKATQTRPYAADTSDATRRLEDAIRVALDVIDGDVLHAEVDGVEYTVRPVQKGRLIAAGSKSGMSDFADLNWVVGQVGK